MQAEQQLKQEIGGLIMEMRRLNNLIKYNKTLISNGLLIANRLRMELDLRMEEQNELLTNPPEGVDQRALDNLYTRHIADLQRNLRSVKQDILALRIEISHAISDLSRLETRLGGLQVQLGLMREFDRRELDKVVADIDLTHSCNISQVSDSAAPARPKL